MCSTVDTVKAEPDDRAKRGASGDEAEQPLALLGIEDIDDHLPEDRHHEQIEDRNPDEEDASDPDGLLRRRRIQREREQENVGAEEAIGDRNECLAAGRS